MPRNVDSTPKLEFTDDLGFDWYLYQHDWDYPWFSSNHRVAAFGSNRFVHVWINEANYSELCADLYEVDFETHGLTLVASTNTPLATQQGDWSWESSLSDTVGFFACSETQGVFVGLAGRWNVQYNTHENEWMAIGLTVGPSSLSWGPLYTVVRDDSFGYTGPRSSPYDFTSCPRADPADGIVVGFIHQTPAGMNPTAVLVAPDGSIISYDPIGYQGRDGVPRADTGWDFYPASPLFAASVVDGQEYLHVIYGFDSSTETEILITSLPISAGVAPISQHPPVLLFAADPSEIIIPIAGSGLIWHRSTIAVGEISGTLIAQLPRIIRGTEGRNNVEIRAAAIEFDGTDHTILYDVLLEQTNTSNADPYGGPMVVVPGTDEAITVWMYGYGSKYRIRRLNPEGLLPESEMEWGTEHTIQPAYWDFDWWFFPESSWAVIASNNYINTGTNTNWGQTLWLVNTHIVPPLSRVPRSISARRGGPRVVFE